MPRANERDPIYRGRRFPPEIIELCVRWYITFRLSYRDLVLMMAERGIGVSHTTIMRWVLNYVPEYERRWARFSRPVHASWRMDETAVRVRGGRHYLYRAVDRNGKSVGSLLCVDRSMASAQTFFRKVVNGKGVVWPSKINLDGHAASHRALRLLSQEDLRWQSVVVRSNRYLNNVIEQDHRAIKQRCASMLGLKSYRTAAITLSGIELAHRIRKRQYSIAAEGKAPIVSLKQRWESALSMDPSSTAQEELEFPAMHQNSTRRQVERSSLNAIRSVRYARKLSRGGGLYLLVSPRGSGCWRYNYRYRGKYKTLALGIDPHVPEELARSRHSAARQLLAAGIDPALRKQEVRYCWYRIGDFLPAVIVRD